MSNASGGQVSPLENRLLKLRKLNISCEAAITLLNTCPIDMHTFVHQEAPTRMLILAIFIITNILINIVILCMYYGIVTQWNITQQWKGSSYSYTQPQGESHSIME